MTTDCGPKKIFLHQVDVEMDRCFQSGRPLNHFPIKIGAAPSKISRVWLELQNYATFKSRFMKINQFVKPPTVSKNPSSRI